MTHIIGNPPPAAYFYWSPTVTPTSPDTIMIGSNAFYSFRMTTPTIAVGTVEQVQVSFDFELDFFSIGGTEGLFIEYRIPGQDWQIVLNPEVAPGVLVNYPLRNDSYIANVTDSIQLGFHAYGTNSLNINSWDIDNVTITPLPQLTFVSISSNNSLDSTLAVPGHTIGILDETGNLLSSGELGTICVKSPDPVMFLKYWNNREATKEKFLSDPNGDFWLDTGDKATMDDEGWIYFVGRADDVINSAGYRIGPAEVENSLLSHPAIAMSAVIGVPDEARGELVKAFIILKENNKPSDELALEIQNYVKSR